MHPKSTQIGILEASSSCKHMALKLSGPDLLLQFDVSHNDYRYSPIVICTMCCVCKKHLVSQNRLYWLSRQDVQCCLRQQPELTHDQVFKMFVSVSRQMGMT